MSLDFCVSLQVLRDAVGLPAVCDCGISSSYSLTIFGVAVLDIINTAITCIMTLPDDGLLNGTKLYIYTKYC